MSKPVDAGTKLALQLRADRELTTQQIRLPFRVLCGVLTAFLGVGIAALLSAHEWLPAAAFVWMMIASGWMTVFGLRTPVVATEASERFHELADPTRPLPDSVVAPAASTEADGPSSEG